MQQLVDLFGLRRVEDRSQDLVDLELGRARQRVEEQQVLGMNESDDVIEVALVDRQASVAVLLEDSRNVLQCGAPLHSHHVGARNHHLADRLVAGLDDAVNHVALLLLDHALLLRDVEQRDELILCEVWSLGRAATSKRARDDRHRPQHRAQEGGHAVDRARRHQRHAFGVSDGECLRRDLSQQQQQHRQQQGHEQRQPQHVFVRHAPGVEKVVGQKRGGAGRDDQCDGVDQQDCG